MEKRIIELSCRITELEEINAGLMLEREKLYQALHRQISERAFHEKQLRYEIAGLTQERDGWKDKAVEISHMLTYTMESIHYRDLHLVLTPEKLGQDVADGPVPEMYHGA